MSDAAEGDPLWTVSAPVFRVPERAEPVAAFTVFDWAGPNGVRVAGLDPFEVPRATVRPDGMVETPRLRLVGRYRAERLELTEPPILTDEWTPDPLLPNPLSLSALIGPFDIEEGDGSEPGHEDASTEAAIAYVESQPDRGAVMRDDSGVLVASFTADLDRHRKQIRRVYGGRLALVVTEASWAVLKGISDQLHHELANEGVGLFESRMIFDVLQAVVPAAAPDQIAAIRRRHGFAAESDRRDGPTRRSTFQIATWLRPVARQE